MLLTLYSSWAGSLLFVPRSSVDLGPLGAFSVAPLQVHHCVCSRGVSELKVECLPPCLNSLISDFVFIIICAFVF